MVHEVNIVYIVENNSEMCRDYKECFSSAAQRCNLLVAIFATVPPTRGLESRNKGHSTFRFLICTVGLVGMI